MAVAGTRSRGRRVARRGLLLVLRRGGGEAEEEKEKEHDNGGMVSGLFGGCLRPVRACSVWVVGVGGGGGLGGGGMMTFQR